MSFKQQNKFSFAKKILLFVGIFLLFGSNVYGAVSYERNPTGFSISSPVFIDVSWNDYYETECSYYNSNVWGIGVEYQGEFEREYLYSEWVSEGINNYVFELDLPVGLDYRGIAFSCLADGINPMLATFYLEGEWMGETIFEVVETPEPEVPIISIPANFTTSTLAYAGALFTDLTPVIILAIGLSVGFWVIKKVISMGKVR